MKTLTRLTSIDYTKLAPKTSIEKTLEALTEHSFLPVVVKSKEEALAKIQELVPAGVSIMNGASETLREIGFTELLKSGKHKWNNLHDAIHAEKDPAKQAQLRKESVLSDYYLGSAHAITESGELVISSNSGSQLPHLAYTSPNIVLVVSSKKIVPTLAEAFDRLEVHVIPLEDERMKKVYGFGTMHSKTLILRRENPAIGRKVHVIIVNESLGF